MNDADELRRARLAHIDDAFCRAIPYNAWLGLRTEDVGHAGEGRIVLRLPFRAELVGNPVTGVLHGGPISAAMDAASGGAVFLALRAPRRIATLDLRIDYLRGAPPGADIFFRAECYRLTHQIAFTRGVADLGDETSPLATSAGTFMIFAEGSALADGLAKGETKA